MSRQVDERALHEGEARMIVTRTIRSVVEEIWQRDHAHLDVANPLDRPRLDLRLTVAPAVVASRP